MEKDDIRDTHSTLDRAQLNLIEQPRPRSSGLIDR